MFAPLNQYLLFDSSRWYHLTSYSLVMSSATWRPAPASTPPHPKQRRPFKTISGKSISCRAQLVWRICSRTTKKDDFSMPVNNCRAGNRTHTWNRWIQVKICCTGSVLCDLSKWQHLFQSNSMLFKILWSLSKYFKAILKSNCCPCSRQVFGV